MDKKASIGIGLMGLGVIGEQVARVLTAKQSVLSEQAGVPLALKKGKVLASDLERPLAKEFPELFTTDDEEFFNEPGIDIVVEAIGGENPALEYVSRALKAGKHVVTSNKELIAKHGATLRKLAEQQGVGLRYEASVGGGIPLISRFEYDLAANKVSGIYAIINGTTNYILTRMAREGMDFSVVLAKAQELGYAEADPVNDVEGIDAAYKIAILASLAFHTEVRPEEVHCEGVSRLSSRDFRYAEELGFAIKLLAIAKDNDGKIEVRVHPVFIPEDSLLAKVDGVYNAVLIEGDLVEKVLFFGQGAGPLPTSSAVIADVIATAREICLGVPGTRRRLKTEREVKPMSELETRYYLRLNAVDRPGVLAQVARTLGDYKISISSAIQKMADAEKKTAEIVIITHTAREQAMQEALTEMARLPVVNEISNFVRVEDQE